LALKILWQSPDTFGFDGYAGISLGHAKPRGESQAIEIPYLPIPLGLLDDGSVLSAFIDPTQSSSVQVNTTLGTDSSGRLFVHSRSLSFPDTMGKSAPLDETAYLTFSDELYQVFPQPISTPSKYRSLLSDRLVMDVWGLHGFFSPPGGVLIAWQAQSPGHHHIQLTFADTNASCGDGVNIYVRRENQRLANLPVANGQTEQQTWEGETDLAAGELLRFAVDRRSNNHCDSTSLRITITDGHDTFDSVTDFSGTQGWRGFFYREFSAEEETPLIFNSAQNRWEGSSPFSIISAGFVHPGSSSSAYADAAEMVSRYLEYGLDRLVIIFHNWQRWGYDQGLPDHHPANPALGTGEQMSAFIGRARGAGMLVALHENYTDIYPNNPPDYPSPLFDETAIALDWRGQRKLGWYNPGTGQQAYIISAQRMIDFSRLESADIARDYAPNAAYLDVSTGWSPGRAIDHDAVKGNPPTLAFSFQAHRELFNFIRDLYRGPLLGEGGEGRERFDSYFAGLVDAVERQTEGRSWARLIPDYELLCIRPLMLNHGQGYYSRYFAPFGQETPRLADADLDQYRVAELTFGHAGFLGDSLNEVDDWLQLHSPEYWLLQALQKEYADARLVHVGYHDGNGFIDLKNALERGLDFTRARLHIEYENLSLYLNGDRPGGHANSVSGFSHMQGEGGWGYFEDQGAGLIAMSWDPENARWQGSRPWSLLAASWAHPDGAAVVRAFTVPLDAELTLSVAAEDADTSCGDGALVRLLHDSSEIWRCDFPGTVNSPCPRATFAISASAGERLLLRIEPKGNINCDSTYYQLDISWRDSQSHDWSIVANGETVTLPPSGFFAMGSSALSAGTIRLSSEPQRLVDFVLSPGYEYLRSRDGQLASVRNLATDGALARKLGPNGYNLHGLSLTRAEYSGRPMLSLSARADFNLRFIAPDRALLILRHAASNPMTVQWADAPRTWREELLAGKAMLKLAPSDWQGELLEEEKQVEFGADATARLDNLIEGQYYRLRLETPCGDGACRQDLGENCQSCPADCPTPAASVCCSGQLFQGECCSDQDCLSGRLCREHICQDEVDGGGEEEIGDKEDGGGEDALADDFEHADGGIDAGDTLGADGLAAASGCGCGSQKSPAANSLWAALFIPQLRRRRSQPHYSGSKARVKA